MKYGEIRGIKHYVYDSAKEFNNNVENVNVKLKYWKDDDVEEGDWVIADDDGVVQILKKGKLPHHNDRKNYSYGNGYVRTIVGSFTIQEKTFMDTDFDLHPNRYTFSKNLKISDENFKKRKNVTNNEKLFITEVVTGKDAVTAVKNVYGTQDFKKAKSKAFALLKQERIMNEVEKGVIDIAKGLGIDHEYVLGTLKHLADRSDDDNIVLQSAKELGKIIGTSGNVLKQRDVGLIGMFGGFSKDQLQDAKRTEQIEGK